MKRTRLIRAVTAAVASSVVATVLATVGWVSVAQAAGGPNLSLGKTVSASSQNGPYVASNLNDGNQGSYWESAGSTFPQWAQIDLGSGTSIDQVVLKLPTGWETRTQTLSVQGSPDGTNFSILASSAGREFNPASNNIVTINFAAASARYVRVTITANTGWQAAQLAELEVYGTASSSTNLAQGRPTLSSGHADVYGSGNAVDGNQGTYWESVNNAFPQWVQVDLGVAQAINRVVLKLPTGWGSRTQTLSVRGSTTGSTFTDVVASAQYAFNPAIAGNSVTITFGQTSQRYVRIQFTANTAWPAGQLSELEVYGAGTGTDTTPPSVPGTLSFTQSGTAITLSWGASTDTGGSGLAGYNVYRDGTQIATLGSVLTYQDTQPETATVSYFVRARDSAGNMSGNSNTVTRTGTQPPGCDNVAQGKTMSASGSTFSFVPANANDGNIATYWEGAAGFPATLTAALGANHSITEVRVKLNPDPAWGTRTQNIQVLGRDQAGSTYTNLVSAQTYTFTQGDNVVSIPVTATTADVRLSFNSNSGASSGQVAELEVCGTPAPNPDLTVSNVAWSPTSPSESTSITLSATVTNVGTANAGASKLDFLLNGAVKGTADVLAINAGQSRTVTLVIGSLALGDYTVAARADATNLVVEQNEGNNTGTNPTAMVVTQAPGPDLQVTGVSANPSNPAVGAAVSFTLAVNNRGTTGVSAGTVSRVTVGSTTLNNTNSPAIPAGQTVSVTISGTWTATGGGATITATADATNTVAETNESNNTLSQSIVVGRGAAVPYTSYEAEAGTYQGTLLTADPLRTFGHTNFATESSGRQSVRLNSQGQFVQFTSTNQTNSIVVRNSIPDAAGGGGITATISLYANGSFVQKLTLSSRNSWLYGTTDDTESLSNTPSGDARRLFDESHALLSQSYPPGTVFKLQRDAGDNASFYIIDLIDLEQVAPALSQPPDCTSITAYGAVPNDGVDDTQAIQRAVTDDENGVISCVWIPSGQWRQEQKILSIDPNRGQYNQKGIRNVVIRGAGMWHTQLYTNTEPQNVVGNINHPHEGNVGFDIDENTQLSDLAIFGMTTNRANRGHAINGRLGNNTKISNVWIEHVNVGAWVGRDFSDTPAYWNPGNNLDFTGMRIRDTYADGINFSNGTRNSRVFNSSFRTTGDDSLAVWANPRVRDTSVDVASNNHFVNNTVQLPWRANGIAIYGGFGNTIENNLVYDTMNYPGIMLATDHDPLPFTGTTLIANNALHRCGGVFWNEDQEFGAITLFAQGKDIVGVTIRDTEIYDSTYDGIQFKTGGGNMPNVAITNVRIDDSNNGAGILAMSGARGNAILTDVTITNSADGDIVTQPGSQFVIAGG